MPPDLASMSSYSELTLFDRDQDFDAKLGRAIDALGGTVDYILAQNEILLMLAAELRERYGAQGDKVEDVRRFRDKTIMKQAVQAAGIRVPAYVDLADSDPFESARTIGYPIVLKPKDGRGSIGVAVCTSEAELEHALIKLTSPIENYELEEFVDGYVTHIDGVVQNGVPVYSVVFRSIGTPFEFSHRNMPSGEYSLLPSDPNYHTLIDFAHKTLSALSLNNSAFHLEVIEDTSGGICFLELGARPGGGFTTQNITKHFGYQIIADDLRLRIGESLATDQKSIKEPVGSIGDLMFPVPLDGKKYRVALTTKLVGVIPEIFEEHLPEVGSVLHGDPIGHIYVNTAGTFRFKGESQELVARAIERTAKEYEYQLDVLN